MKQRLTILRANLIGTALIVLLVVVLLNFMAARHHKRFDLTGEGEHTLAPQTVKLLESLDAPLKVKVFDKLGGASREKAQTLLNSYKYYSDKIETSFIDPDKKPALAEEYGVQRYGTLFFEYKGRQEQTEQVTEESFTNIILKLSSGEQKKIYFLSGHGENDPEATGKLGYSRLKEAIEKQNYQVQKLLLMRRGQVPQDCSVLIVSGPEKELFPEEKQAIEQYLRRGGSALFLLDPPPGIGLRDFLAKWEIKVGRDMVIDKLSRLFGGDYFMPVITNYGHHPITRDFNLASFFPVTRSVTPAPKDGKGLPQILASTSPESWAETDYKSRNYQYDKDKDLKGPVSVAVALEMSPAQEKEQGAEKKDSTGANQDKEKEPVKEKRARLVVVGDADFANNTYLNLSGNRDLFLNMLNWLAKEETLISIRPKNAVTRTVNLTRSQMQGVFYLTVILIPLVLLGIGLLVWAKRRES